MHLVGYLYEDWTVFVCDKAFTVHVCDNTFHLKASQQATSSLEGKTPAVNVADVIPTTQFSVY
jgi:hypothetical protein